MDTEKILMGTLANNISSMQSITFCVTEECNLRCKYCYMTHKNSYKTMSIATAKTAVNFILNYFIHPDTEYASWEFIGGEPTLEMGLIDQITDYIKLRMYEMNHPWTYTSTFHIGTNGILYQSKPVQDYIEKNKGIVSFSVTIDGNKEKHDMQRVHLNGNGSFDEVLSSVELWKKQFPMATTKVTFSSDDLKYLKDSIIYLWQLGLRIIPANFVYENVWKQGDAEIFEKQLIALADYIIENNLFYDYSVRFFAPTLGYQMSHIEKQNNFCGSGKMVAVDCDGKLFPCIRFLDFCTTNTVGMSSGDINIGFNQDVLAEFAALTIENISSNKCNTCSVASGCFACAGNNYVCTGSIHNRTIYHCEMQKANVRANKYFWRRFSEKTGFISEREKSRFASFVSNHWKLDGLKFLYILTTDDFLPFGDYQPKGANQLSMYDFNKFMNLAYEKDLVPVIVGNPNQYLTQQMRLEVHISIIDGSVPYLSDSSVEWRVGIFDCKAAIVSPQKVNILVIRQCDLEKFQTYSMQLLLHSHRLNILPLSFDEWDAKEKDTFASVYKELEYFIVQNELKVQLQIVKPTIKDENSYLLAPNGKVYNNPYLYYADEEKNAFDIEELNEILCNNTICV